MTTTPSWLDPSTFVRGPHGDAAIVEPATGNELSRTGVADAADVARAATQAAAAQRDRAAVTEQRWITVRGEIPAYRFSCL